MNELTCGLLELRNVLTVYTRIQLHSPSKSGNSSSHSSSSMEYGQYSLTHLLLPVMHRLSDPALFHTCCYTGLETFPSGIATSPEVQAYYTSLLACNRYYAEQSQGVYLQHSNYLHQTIYQQLRTAEFEFCCTALNRYLHNYKLASLMLMPVFHTHTYCCY